MPLASLPVDAFIDQIRSALDSHRAAVLTAAPGAGKTTRVPPALAGRGRVLLLQPRRVAARAIARRIADEQGWTPGKEVGWHIRFERRFASDTRVLVVTEGILTAYLQDDPLVTTTSTLILDEFHERSVHADLGLALARQAWLARADLRILVMSATLDTEPISRFLGHCPVIHVPGSPHPVTVSYTPGQSIADALDDVLPSAQGNVLCFLPGAGEIARAMAEAAAVAARHSVEMLPLHGSLDADSQDAALTPTAGRRVTLATNIAETSLTVPGVSVVIDSGTHKVARYNAERGVDSLTLERITSDCAQQRAGRAGRLGPGVVRRLWDGRDRLRPHREPEILRVDLAGPLLSVLAWGGDPESFEWFDRPPDDRVRSALVLLERLGLLRDGRVTAAGSQAQRLPLHPRLSRVLLDGRGSFEAASACAWLSEPGRFDGRDESTACDLLPIIDAWSRMSPHLKRVGRNLEQAAIDLLGDKRASHVDETSLRRALLAGYPDRVARRRTQGDRLTLATGHGAIMARESGVREGEWVVALEVAAATKPGSAEAMVRAASRVEPEWLTPTRRDVIYSVTPDTGLVKARATDWYDALVLSERPADVDPDRAVQMRAQAWLDRGVDQETERLLRRASFARQALDLPALARAAAAHARGFSDMNIIAMIPSDVRRPIDRDAPEFLGVPSGRSMRIEYAADGSASVSVKLQELFGLASTPRLGPRQVPITFHLLAPNGRPVQSTSDLKSFWSGTYREVRKELRGRYPRHPWPEDPWTAVPTHRTTKRQPR